MYWIFLVLFLLSVLTPDIIRHDVYFLSQERAEEVVIFILGAIGFLVFIFKEKQLSEERRERERSQQRLNQTGKDLAESYGYIGEVNRKIDILMGIILGFSSGSILNKKEEREAYNSIIDAANFLMKAECSALRFVNIETGQTERDVFEEGRPVTISNKELTEIEKNNMMKRTGENIIIPSLSKIDGTRAYLIIHNYNEKEENNPKNIEILRVLVSQALLLYSYVVKHKNDIGFKDNN